MATEKDMNRSKKINEEVNDASTAASAGRIKSLLPKPLHDVLEAWESGEREDDRLYLVQM